MGKKSREKEIEDVVARCVEVRFDGVKKEDVKASTRFVEDLGCDFLDIVEFFMLVESVFSRSIPSEEETNIRTVGDVVAFYLKEDAEMPLTIDEGEIRYF